MTMSSASASSSYGNQEGSSQSSSGTLYDPTARNRMNELYPYIRGQLPTSQQMNFNSLFGQVGGQTPQYPGITTGPIWNQKMIDERTHLSQAQNIAQTGGDINRMRSHYGGSGMVTGTNFGGGSNIEKEREDTLNMGLRSLNTKTANDLAFGTAKDNAQHLLATQQANVARTQAQSEDEIRRRQLALQAQQQLMQQQGALLASLYQYNQPLPFGSSSSSNRGRQGSGSVSVSGDMTPLSIANGGLNA